MHPLHATLPFEAFSSIRKYENTRAGALLPHSKWATALFALLSAFAGAAEPWKETIELPGLSPHVSCEATRQGLVCRVAVHEAVPFGQRREIRLTTAEPGVLRPATLKTGKFVQARPAPQKGQLTLKGNPSLTFDWTFEFDSLDAEKAFQAESERLTARAAALADEKGLKDDPRKKFVESQVKSLASERSKDVAANRGLFLLDDLKRLKTRLAAESVLRGKLTSAEQASTIKAFVDEDVKKIRKALNETEFVRAEFKKLDEKFRQGKPKPKNAEEEARFKQQIEKLQNQFLVETSDTLLADVKTQRPNQGWNPPASIVALQDGLLRLKRLYEWQAAERLFLELEFVLDADRSSKWLTLHADLVEWLLRKKRPETAPPSLLDPAEIARLTRESTVDLAVEFWPTVVGGRRDIGWAGAHKAGLKDGVVGSMVWKGRAALGDQPAPVWLELDAPEGILLDFGNGADDVTACVAKVDNRQFVRIAPRKGSRAADFDLRISHPGVKGAEIRWEPPVQKKEVKFPF